MNDGMSEKEAEIFRRKFGQLTVSMFKKHIKTIRNIC